MSRAKTYGMACPISLSLDLLGDRWALHVLRELHAGPSNFAQIKTGLAGIATNMLSTRLRELSDSGLIEKRDRTYSLTQMGFATRPILFELARFGRPLPAPVGASDTAPIDQTSGDQTSDDHTSDDPKSVSHHAVILAGAIERAAGPMDDIHAELTLDDVPYSLTVAAGRADLQRGTMALAPLRFSITWADIETVARGDSRISSFAAEREIIAQDPLLVATFLDLLQKALDIYGGFK